MMTVMIPSTRLMMIRVRGIYDGKHVRLLEDLDVPPQTEVEVLVSDADSGREDDHWQRLIDAGVIAERPHPDDLDDSFEPIPNGGEPISDTIIRERR